MLQVIVTFGLAALLIVVTRLRHTRPVVRASALIAAATLAGVVLHLHFLLMVLPMTNHWLPAEWQRPDLLVPFRSCRGALLWATSRNRAGEVRAYEVARVDDVWLRFADPRLGGASVRAVSAAGRWREGYLWLRQDDAARLYVRRDDPAVVRCDSRPRPEPVAPASWHLLGADELIR